MGQRLNLEITFNGETVANCHYHWSGYTSTALETTDKAVACVSAAKTPKTKDEAAALALLALLDTGAMIRQEELDAMADRFPGTAGAYSKTASRDADMDRNKGLIAFSEKGMAETSYWAEAVVSVDLTSGTVLFGAVCDYDDEEDTEPEEEHILDIRDIDPDEALPYKRFHALAVLADIHPRPWYWRNNTGTMWCCIE